LPRTHNPKRSGRLASSAAAFAALGDETRLRLMARLCDSGPLSIAALTTGFVMTRQAITKHLYVMKDAGLVRCSQHGRESVWAVEQKRLDDVRKHLEMIAAQWDHTLGRLKQFVER
jgi:DNA-binding transcriptional ArsR family regulator